MVLSIGMIVKNEEKYLERCLTALQPILKELDSELIIADTGSTDRTVEIAKKFTDKVFHFEWINDFAAARNFTLEKAQGEWFMFVDADEIAQDCIELINFFQTGLYKQFNAVSVIVRNFNDANNWGVYSDLRATRMVRRLPETKFHNPIHEVIRPISSPSGYMNFVLNHYGYVFSGESGKEFAKQKGKRNLELLLEELDKGLDKDRYIVYQQIADCYSIMGDSETALKYLKTGLEKTGHNDMLAVVFYSKMISALIKLERCDEVISVSDEYFDVGVNTFRTQELGTDCLIRWARGYSFFKRQEYGKALDECVRFLDLNQKYNSGELNTDDLYISDWDVNERVVRSGYEIFFLCCYHEKRFELANEYARSFSVTMFADNPEMLKNHLNIRVEMMDVLGYDGLDELCGQCDDAGRSHILFMVRLKALATAPKNRATLVAKLSAFGGMPAELAEIYKSYYDNIPDFGLIKTFLEKYGSALSVDMLYILLEKQMDITPFLASEDFAPNIAASCLSRFFTNGIELFENYDIDNISPEGLEKASGLCGQFFSEAVASGRIISPLFEKFGSMGLKWYNAFGDSVPGDVFIALMVNNIVAARNIGDREQFTNAIGEFKARVPALGMLADLYAQEVEGSFAT